MVARLQSWALLLGLSTAVCSSLLWSAPTTVSFRQPMDISGGTVQGVSSMDAADLTGNGLIDIAVIEGGKHAGGRRTFVWFEATTNTAQPWVRHEFHPEAPLRSFLGAARLADMDNDGDPDLIVSSDHHSGTTREADVLLFLNPRPALDVRTRWPMRVIAKDLSLHHINDMEVADLDADGWLDIVARSLEPNQIHLFFLTSGRTSEHRAIDTHLDRSEGLAVGDLNADGKPEITFTGYILRAPISPRTQAYRRIEVDPDYHTVNQNTKEAIGDLNGDGHPDLTLAPAEKYRGGKPHLLAWYQNPGGNLESTWVRHAIVESINNLHTLKLGDLNGDEALDIVTGQPWDGLEVKAYFNDGTGSFPQQQQITTGKGLYSGVLADLEADGDLDIVGQDRYSADSRPYVYKSLLLP